MDYLIAPTDESTATVNFTTVANGLEIRKVLNQTPEEQVVEVIFPRLITIAPPAEGSGSGGSSTHSYGNA